CGGSPGEGPPGTGGHPGGGEPGRAPACTIAHDTSLGTAEPVSPAIAFGDKHFAVAWIERGTGRHAPGAGEAGPTGGSSRGAADPRAANTSVSAQPGGDFLVVWQEPGVVRGARVGADASTRGAPFAIASTASADARPSAAGSQVAWTDTTGVVVGELQGTTV